jgi:hypothetical protein
MSMERRWATEIEFPTRRLEAACTDMLSPLAT